MSYLVLDKFGKIKLCNQCKLIFMHDVIDVCVFCNTMYFFCFLWCFNDMCNICTGFSHNLISVTSSFFLRVTDFSYFKHLFVEKFTVINV